MRIMLDERGGGGGGVMLMLRGVVLGWAMLRRVMLGAVVLVVGWVGWAV